MPQIYLNCLDATPNLFGVFDTAIAPGLLYYAYMPIILLSLLFGLLVFRSNIESNLSSRLFFGLTIAFSLFLLNEIVQWIAVPTAWVHLAWELSPFFQVLIMLLLMYFISVFINRSDVVYQRKLFFALLFLPVLLFLPTSGNMSSFDFLNCQANVAALFNYVYFLQGLTVIFIVYVCLKKYFAVSDPIHKKQIIYILFGSASFAIIFGLSDILGELTKAYEINLIGPLGMLIFLGFLTYMIVKFQAFNVKLFSAQALVWGMVFFIGTQFFKVLL